MKPPSSALNPPSSQFIVRLARSRHAVLFHAHGRWSKDRVYEAVADEAATRFPLREIAAATARDYGMITGEYEVETDLCVLPVPAVP